MVFGLTFLIIAFFWIFTRINNNETINLFDWFYTAIFGLNGLVHIIAGLGYSIESIFGKAFIKIDNDNINIKLGIFEKEKSFDVIILDLKMPELNGIQVFEHIRKKDKEVPVFAITAFAMEDEKQKIEKLGFNKYFSKPINKNELFSALGEILN
jgi:CheY-like chemotaxis protein